MRVLITGANGQVGWELQRTVPSEFDIKALDRSQLDITNLQAVKKIVDGYKPELIINTAAYTKVDKAEEEPELAYAVNAEGAANIAKAAHECGARLIHLSTDFVFDGENPRPYKPDDATNPINIYGKSKRDGELKILDATNGQALILRTAWVYSAHGSNFVKTMLRLMTERDELRVVEDQIGTPTWAYGLSKVIWVFAKQHELKGAYHWTDAGVASWYDFAAVIQEIAMGLKLIPKAIPIIPIPTNQYPTPAKRPLYCILNKTDTWALLAQASLHWKDSLYQMLSSDRCYSIN